MVALAVVGGAEVTVAGGSVGTTAVALGGTAVAGLSLAAGIWLVGAISDGTGAATVGVAVKGLLVGSGVLVGRTIQAMGVGSRLSKVGGSVRAGRGWGRRCLASWVNAVLKMI
jgi:hypothetical protein